MSFLVNAPSLRLSSTVRFWNILLPSGTCAIPKEYDLLFYLVKNMNIALSREKLLEEVWGFDFYGDDRTVDTHIKMLRNSLGKYRNLIVTLRGMGYKFEKIQ